MQEPSKGFLIVVYARAHFSQSLEVWELNNLFEDINSTWAVM